MMVSITYDPHRNMEIPPPLQHCTLQWDMLPQWDSDISHGGSSHQLGISCKGKADLCKASSFESKALLPLTRLRLAVSGPNLPHLPYTLICRHLNIHF